MAGLEIYRTAAELRRLSATTSPSRDLRKKEISRKECLETNKTEDVGRRGTVLAKKYKICTVDMHRATRRESTMSGMCRIACQGMCNSLFNTKDLERRKARCNEGSRHMRAMNANNSRYNPLHGLAIHAANLGTTSSSVQPSGCAGLGRRIYTTMEGEHAIFGEEELVVLSPPAANESQVGVCSDAGSPQAGYSSSNPSCDADCM